MKTPLRYQLTEYDCAPTCFFNALLCIFDREEIPIAIVKNIYKYTLDEMGQSGVLGEWGTSSKAVRNLIHWLNVFDNSNELGLNVELLDCDNQFAKIRQCVADGGCVVARCYQTNEHYILITDMDEDFAYVWDPYYLDSDYYDNDDCVDIIEGQKLYNRMVRLCRLRNKEKKDFSLISGGKRELVMINRVKSVE